MALTILQSDQELRDLLVRIARWMLKGRRPYMEMEAEDALWRFYTEFRCEPKGRFARVKFLVEIQTAEAMFVIPYDLVPSIEELSISEGDLLAADRSPSRRASQWN